MINRYGVYDSTGRILRVVRCPGTEIEIQLAQGESAVEIPEEADDTSYYVVSGVAQPLPQRPDPTATFNYLTSQWVEDLSAAKAKAWSAVKAERDARILAAGSTSVGVFDTTAEGRANITSVAVMLLANTAVQSVNFTLANNQRVEISRAAFLTAALQIGAAVQSLYDEADSLRSVINDAGSANVAAAVSWPQQVEP